MSAKGQPRGRWFNPAFHGPKTEAIAYARKTGRKLWQVKVRGTKMYIYYVFPSANFAAGIKQDIKDGFYTFTELKLEI